jgi:hypothetical protein
MKKRTVKIPKPIEYSQYTCYILFEKPFFHLNFNIGFTVLLLKKLNTGLN